MSERTKLLKKAVLTGVGATTNGERIKAALTEAMDDLVKIGQELLDELESRGKVKAKSAQDFVKNLRDEAGRRSGEVEKRVSSKVHDSMQKAAREFGLATRGELDEIIERLEHLESGLDGQGEPSKKADAAAGTRARRGPKSK